MLSWNCSLPVPPPLTWDRKKTSIKTPFAPDDARSEPLHERGWLWCDTLGFWLGTWQGTVSREPTPRLRFYHRDGNLVLMPEEAEKQQADRAQKEAETEKQRADRLAARLRELGENLDL